MGTRYLKRAAVMFLLILFYCSLAEAGASATKAYRFSVTVPARTYVDATMGSLSTSRQDRQMLVAMEEGVRNNQVVMIKTAVIK